ncbi:MAG: hypothetical protein HKP30_07080 [Myxococcales bacterium]|nr:hypothetical protein [Myxococcales bacterium]
MRRRHPLYGPRTASRHPGPPRRSRFARFLAGLAIALSAGVAVAADSSPAAWFPLEPGHVARYQTHRDRMLERPGTTVDRQFYHGTSIATVLATTALDAGRIQLRWTHSEREANLTSAVTQRGEEIQSYSVQGGRVLLHGHVWPGVAERRITYDPPRTVLRGPLEPGRRWKVGVLREGGLAIDAKAEVLARESVTIAGQVHPGAIHVQLSGAVTGALEFEDVRYTVREGEYRQDLWLARGVGPLREVVAIDLRAEDADGESLRLSDVVRRTLRPAAERAALP